MGTRSRIAILNTDGSYTSIYCHWDGYPAHNGFMLHNHYNSEEFARSLIGLGDMSSLGPLVEESTFYHRDRGEFGVDPLKSATYEDLCKATQECGGEFLYVFKDGRWFCAEGGIAFFGMPADKAPGGLEPVEKFLPKEETA
jgi:hypothetical protein